MRWIVIVYAIARKNGVQSVYGDFTTQSKAFKWLEKNPDKWTNCEIHVMKRNVV